MSSKIIAQQSLNSIQTLLKSPDVNRMPLIISNDHNLALAVQTYTESKCVTMVETFLLFLINPCLLITFKNFPNIYNFMCNREKFRSS